MYESITGHRSKPIDDAQKVRESGISGRKKIVFCAYNGIWQDKCTIKEIAKVLGITGSRVRQIYKEAEKIVNSK